MNKDDFTHLKKLLIEADYLTNHIKMKTPPPPPSYLKDIANDTGLHFPKTPNDE